MLHTKSTFVGVRRTRACVELLPGKCASRMQTGKATAEGDSADD
jgi:hypothetical protein